jgi:peptide/nickel transport system permease protein
MGVLFILVLGSVGAPWLARHDPNRVNISMARQAPDSSHMLGADLVGRDVLSRVLHGGRVSLSVGLISVSISTAIGTLLGCVAGYSRGWLDHLIMRATDVVMSLPNLVLILVAVAFLGPSIYNVMSLPNLVLILVAVAFLGPSIYNVMLVIGLLGWPSLCRLVRGQFLTVREAVFVEAAVMLGLPNRRIIFLHILPHVIPYVIVAATFSVANAILSEAALSFLGLGVQPPTASWGSMLNAAQNITVIGSMPWLWLPPGIAITLCILSINFLGDALRDALDPQLKIR